MYSVPLQSSFFPLLRMASLSHNRLLLIFSLILVVLISLTGIRGLLVPGYYLRESVNWQIQATGQDLVDLCLVVPVLLITAFLAFRGRKFVTVLWGGVLLYIIYTFIIYCFTIHFNNLFLVYCFILGISFYLFAGFVPAEIRRLQRKESSKTLHFKITGIYFIFISILFYFLWLSEILPATLNHTVPESLKETGLVTNPVQVLDLSVFLPGIFICGLFLLKRKKEACFFAPAILLFFILMDLTIGTLSVLMWREGLSKSMAPAFIMGALFIFSAALLIWYLRNTEIVDH